MHPVSARCKGCSSKRKEAEGKSLRWILFDINVPFVVMIPSWELRTKMAVVTKVSELGKMNIPVQIRRQSGLERGGPVVMTVVDGEIRLRAVRNVLTSLQRDAASVFADSGVSVEHFLAERRAEAARDEAETQ